MPELDRAADPVRGAVLFGQNCAMCHAPDGAACVACSDDGFRLMVPPLWGPDSFNTGAGMNRLGTVANFVHDNMPNGTSYVMPRLSPEDAWDVAAFVVSQPRPVKAGSRQGLSGSSPEARRHALWPLCGRLQSGSSTSTARSVRSARRSPG